MTDSAPVRPGTACNAGAAALGCKPAGRADCAGALGFSLQARTGLAQHALGPGKPSRAQSLCTLPRAVSGPAVPGSSGPDFGRP